MQKTQLTWGELEKIWYSLYDNRLNVDKMITEARARGENTKGMEKTWDNLKKLGDKVCKMMAEANEEDLRKLGLGK